MFKTLSPFTTLSGLFHSPGTGTFSPRQLFAALQGAWYDPSDFSTMFQDSAGTTPVTAIEQPVGLILDKSKGLALGPELVTNGDFSAGTTGWLNSSIGSSTISVSDGALVISYTNGSNFARAYQVVTTATGSWYNITFQNVGSFTAQIRIGPGTANGPYLTGTVAAGATFNGKFLAGSTSAVITVNNSGGGEVRIDNVSSKVISGSHASQSTTTSRPILRNLYNLLTYTEQFDNAAWAKIGCTVTPNTTQAPDGNVTAATISETTGTQYHSTYGTTVVPSGSSNTFSCYLKKGTWQYAQLLLGNTSPYTTWIQCVIDLDTGLITKSSASATGTLISTNSEAIGGGWYKVSLTGVLSTATVQYQYVGTVTSATPTLNTVGVEYRLGVTTRNIIAWGASLVPANEASLPYQRVVTNTLGSGVYDTDTTKFPAYLRADRTDDSYTTADGGGSTTGFFYCASIILQTAGQTHTLISDTGTNTGYRVRINSSNQVELSAGNGSAYTTATTTDTLSAGQMAVITAWHDGTKLYAQINNGTIAEQAFGTATAGTSTLTIGKDNGAASSYFGGGIYEHVYLKNVSPGIVQREQTKRYCAAKGGITL